MPLLLVGRGSLSIAPLVVTDDVARVPRLGRASPPPELYVAPLVQRPAHRLGGHLWISPPPSLRAGGDEPEGD